MIGLAFWAPHPALKAMPVDRARDSSGHRAAGPEEELQNKNGHPVGATRGSGFSVPPYGMRLDACRRRLTKRDARPAMLLARRWPQRCCWPGKRVLAASHAAMGRHRWSRWRRLDGRLWRRFAKISKNDGKTVPVAHIASKLLITSWIPSAFGTLCCSASDLEAACRAAQHHPRRRVPRERFAQARRGEEPALSFESGSRSKLT